VLLVAASLLAGCGGRGLTGAALPAKAGSTASSSASLPTAKSVSPASIAVVPMQRTARQAVPRRAQSDIRSLAFSSLPGGATFVAASPDGSLWAISTNTAPSGDGYVFHYAYDQATSTTKWTNVAGALHRIAIGPDGTPWGVTVAGGIYRYDVYNDRWTAIAGGGSDISVGPDGSVYVISNVDGGQYGNGIWHYVNGAWTQMPGAGVRVAASWDAATYPGGIGPNGFYVVNLSGAIYYYNPSSGYVALAGGASEIAPTKSGGLFVLAYPADPNGAQVYYRNLTAGASAAWVAQPGAALAMTTDSASLYVVGRGNGIYKSAVQPTLQLSPARIRNFQAWAYAPGGALCQSSADVACDSLWSDNYEVDVTPTEDGGHSGDWTLANDNSAVASAANCPGTGNACLTGATGQIAVQPLTTGNANVTVTGQHAGNNSVLPVSVTETTLVVTIDSVAGAKSITAQSECQPSNACSHTPNMSATFPTQPASGSYQYVFTMKNFPYPVGVTAGDIGFQVFNDSGLAGSGVIVKPTIVEGQANTLYVTVK
jgi:Tectonin domain